MEGRISDAGGGFAGDTRGEDDFRSCCGDEEEWEDTEESFTAGVAKGELDEISVRLFFKGVSSSEEGKKLSGIGVVMDGEENQSMCCSWWPITEHKLGCGSETSYLCGDVIARTSEQLRLQTEAVQDNDPDSKPL